MELHAIRMLMKRYLYSQKCYSSLEREKLQTGFTLTEIAIALVIIGLVVGLGAGMIGSLTRRMKLNETKAITRLAKESLLSYAVRNGYLPPDTGPNPLGIAGARNRDVWGNDLVYSADDALEGISADVCNATSTSFVIYMCEDVQCTTFDTLQNIAFVVFSRGEDFSGEGTGTGAAGSGSPCPAYVMPSCGPGMTCFYVREQGACYEFGGEEYRYDDIVKMVSIFEIQRARKCN